MTSLRNWKLAERAVTRQQEVLEELSVLVKNIERCESTIGELKNELETVNRSHQGQRTTQEDVIYLTELLNCAKKKLRWENQMKALGKRTPQLLERITTLMNDPKAPPSEEIREGMLQALQRVQAAMARLEKAKLD